MTHPGQARAAPAVGFSPLSLFAVGQLPLSQALSCAITLARELEQLHGTGRVLRWLDAASIELEPSTGRVRLGSSTVREPLPAEGVLPAPSVLEGDPAYAAPERTGRLSQPVDQRADLYSLGVVLYRFFVGQLPFSSGDRSELIHSHLARKPLLPTQLDAGIPGSISLIITKLLAKDVQDRYASAAGLLADLEIAEKAWRGGQGLEGFVPGLHEIERTFQVSRKLVGRDEQLAVLLGALDRCSWGRTEIVLVKGPPGIGKSVLVAELRKGLGHDTAFIGGKYEQYRRNVPYSAIVTAFEDLVRHLLAEPERVLSEHRTRILEAIGPNAQLIIELIPDLVHIVGPQPEVPQLGPLEARNRLNRVFRDFVGVFASGEHGLVLFLDDLQWVDAASLALVEVLLTDPMTRRLLVVGAYRDGDVTPAHSLHQLLGSLVDVGIKPTEITLGALAEAQTCAVVAASMGSEADRCAALASLLQDRTAGNPFFLGQYLRVLHERGHLTFERTLGAWVWDGGRVAVEGLTGEVSEFLAGRLRGLDQTTREALTTGSCLGTVFDTAILAAVLTLPVAVVKERLAAAARAGLIEPRDDAGRSSYSFVHDRVQQAAFQMIPPHAIGEFRYRIGRSVMANTSTERLEEMLFEVVDNLNNGVELPLAPDEKLHLARLNLAAGRRARASLAHEDAVRFLRVGIGLLPGDSWQVEYDLAYGLHVECFECEYLSGMFETAESRFEVLVDHAQDRLAAAKVHYTRVLLKTSRGDYAEAVSSGLAALSGFRIRLPRKARPYHILWELLKSRIFLRSRKIETLADLPELSDPELSAITRLLVSFCPAAYFHDPNMMMLAALKIVNISLRRGNPPAASFGYVLMALILGAGMGRYRTAHAFGSLAVRLAWRNDDVAIRSKVVLIFAGFVEFWTVPVDEAIKRLKEGFRISLDAGDHQYANYCALQHQSLAFFRGAPLSVVGEVSAMYASFIDHTRDPFSMDSYRALRQTVLALQGKTNAGWELTTADWNEADEVERMRANTNPTSLYYYRVWKLQLLYQFGYLDQALELAATTTRDFEAGFSQICQLEQSLYSGLTAVALLRDKTGSAHGARKLLRRARRNLQRWSTTCSENFNAAYLLLEAETLALRNGGDSTIRLYDRAIEAARQTGLANLEALANECAATFHSGVGRQGVGRAYLQEARRIYRDWGAVRKVEQLSDRESSLFGVQEPMPSFVPESLSPSRASWGDLDVDVAMKAAQAIGAEYEMTHLLQRLVQVTLEAAGAQRCVLALDDGVGLLIQATGAVDAGDVEVLMARDLGERNEVCEAIVQYAARTRRPLVLTDARVDARFQGSPYVRERAPLSVLAMPLLRQGAVVGVLYLENNLAVGVFTSDKLKVLELVAAKLVIAIENVRLLEGQRVHARDLQSALHRVDILQKAKTHLAKFVPQSVQRIIDDNPYAPALEKQARDVTILFLDMASYTKMSEALDGSRIDHLIERYFSAFLLDILANGGDINETAGDGLMILFLADDPTVHAVQAARTALAIRRRTDEINAEIVGDPVQINIGINSGQAMVGSTKLEAGAGNRYTYTATGTVTNIAARIASAATEGAILVSAETAKRIGSQFVMREPREHRFKNVRDPVQVLHLEEEAPARRPQAQLES